MTVRLTEIADPAARAAELIDSLPRGQRYEFTRHDPPTPEGYHITVQLVGPPAMVGGKFIGWRALAEFNREERQ